ncbi:MAG TPA: hypothetical protein VFG42_26550 [Baekduia sp.]|nr:hypothetical protein [Baekduia sp.]HET6510383.1 hypothetical protein [Baekduia sp.]
MEPSYDPRTRRPPPRTAPAAVRDARAFPAAVALLEALEAPGA